MMPQSPYCPVLHSCSSDLPNEEDEYCCPQMNVTPISTSLGLACWLHRMRDCGFFFLLRIFLLLLQFCTACCDRHWGRDQPQSKTILYYLDVSVHLPLGRVRLALEHCDLCVKPSICPSSLLNFMHHTTSNTTCVNTTFALDGHATSQRNDAAVLVCSCTAAADAQMRAHRVQQLL